MDEEESRIATMNTYVDLLGELNARLISIPILTSKKTTLPGFVVEDTVYLQLRMICEVIALGCLVAHGDIEGARSKQLRRAYAADEIMNALERLHPNFYPQPRVALEIQQDGTTFIMLDPVKDGFATKADIVRLYAICGEKLHRGPIKKLSSKVTHKPDVLPVVDWYNKIVRLMDTHIISIVDSKQSYFCRMKSETGLPSISYGGPR